MVYDYCPGGRCLPQNKYEYIIRTAVSYWLNLNTYYAMSNMKLNNLVITDNYNTYS